MIEPYIALSPNVCAIAGLHSGHEVTLGLLQMPAADTIDGDILEAITEAFALQLSAASTSWSNYQADLLAVMQLFAEQNSDSATTCRRVLSELYRALEVRLDHALEAQADWLFINPIIQRCLGTQISLSCYTREIPRSLPSSIARSLLDIRSGTLVTTYNLKNVPNQTAPNHAASRQMIPTDAEKADDLQEVLGIIKWFTSLMAFVATELFRLSEIGKEDMGESINVTQEAIQSAIHSTSNPALSILLLSSSRFYLKYVCRNFGQYLIQANKFRGYPSALRDNYQTLVSILRNSPVQFMPFERMLTAFDGKIKEAYQNSGLDEIERTRVERQMLVEGAVPEMMMPAVNFLLTTLVDSLREEIDLAELYFSDFSWLDLGGENENDVRDGSTDNGAATVLRKRSQEKKPKVDVLRKIILKPEAKVKRCLRCHTVIEDAPFALRNRAMQQLMRTCLCGDWWMDAGISR